MHTAAATIVADELVDRWASPAKACVHVAVRVNAAIERVRARADWDCVVARLASRSTSALLGEHPD